MGAREAFARGYAESGPLPAPAWVRAVAETVTDAPRLVAEAQGRIEGRRAGLERRRLRLYAKHRTRLLALAASLAAHTPRGDLARALATAVGLSEDTEDRKARRDAAAAAALAILTRALLTTDGLAASWQRANVDAYVDARAEGQAEALASPTEGGPANPRTVAAVFSTAGLATAAAWSSADEWTRMQVSGLAGDLADAAVAAADLDALRAGIDASLRGAVGVAYYLEDEMHRAAAQGFAVYLDAAVATINFVSVGDSRVCPTCAAYAGASPWAPDDIPVPPVHGTCRCWLEYAGAGVPAKGSLTDALV